MLSELDNDKYKTKFNSAFFDLNRYYFNLIYKNNLMYNFTINLG